MIESWQCRPSARSGGGATALVEVAPPLFGGGMRLYFYAASVAGIHRTESEQREHQQNTYSPAECGEWGGPISSVWIAARIACRYLLGKRTAGDPGDSARDRVRDSRLVLGLHGEAVEDVLGDVDGSFATNGKTEFIPTSGDFVSNRLTITA